MARQASVELRWLHILAARPRMIQTACPSHLQAGTPGPVSSHVFLDHVLWPDPLRPLGGSGIGAEGPPKPPSREKVKKGAAEERMENRAECSRIMGLDQDWPHWPWTALNRRGVSSKADDVVPP